MYLEHASIWVFFRASITENATLTKSFQIPDFGFGPFIEDIEDILNPSSNNNMITQYRTVPVVLLFGNKLWSFDLFDLFDLFDSVLV